MIEKLHCPESIISDHHFDFSSPRYDVLKQGYVIKCRAGTGLVALYTTVASIYLLSKEFNFYIAFSTPLASALSLHSRFSDDAKDDGDMVKSLVPECVSKISSYCEFNRSQKATDPMTIEQPIQ